MYIKVGIYLKLKEAGDSSIKSGLSLKNLDYIVETEYMPLTMEDMTMMSLTNM